MHSKAGLDAITTGWSTVMEEHDALPHHVESALDKIVARPYVSIADRIALESVLDATDAYNAMAVERVRQTARNLVVGKAMRERALAADIAAEAERERIEADCRRVERVWDAAVAARAEDKEWRRLRRNSQARARRRARRDSRICVCGDRRCSIGPFNGETSEDESDD